MANLPEDVGSGLSAAMVTVLPHPRVRALGTGQKQRDGGVPKLLEDAGVLRAATLRAAMSLRYATDAHFTQYALFKDDGTPFERTWRLKHGSLLTCCVVSQVAS